MLFKNATANAVIYQKERERGRYCSFEEKMSVFYLEEWEVFVTDVRKLARSWMG